MSRILTLQSEGCKLGTSGLGSHKNLPPERTQIGGWSAHSIRRNNDFLRQVDYKALPPAGLAFTGTVRDCPFTSEDWHKALKAFWKRLNRMGCVLIHWVVEWQRRGVPHLHCSLFFDNPAPDIPMLIKRHWLDLTAKWGSGSSSQYLTPIHDSLGWAQYTAKHAQRGLFHYQRSPEMVPSSWAGRTGRMWGKWGSWPIVDPMKFSLPDEAFFMLRRWVKRWRIADARATRNPKRIRSARRCLMSNDAKLSAVRGMSEWMPSATTAAALHFLASVTAGDIVQIE